MKHNIVPQRHWSFHCFMVLVVLTTLGLSQLHAVSAGGVMYVAVTGDDADSCVSIYEAHAYLRNTIIASGANGTNNCYGGGIVSLGHNIFSFLRGIHMTCHPVKTGVCPIESIPCNSEPVCIVPPPLLKITVCVLGLHRIVET